MSNELSRFVDELTTTMKLVEGTDIGYFFNKLHEETGEVAEVGSAILGSENKQRKLIKKTGSVDAALLEELSDSLVVLAIIARKRGFSVKQLLKMGKNKMAIKNNKRRRANVK